MAAARRLSAALNTDTPPVVYHYTTLPALLGIVSSGEMWLSDVAFADDPSEVRYGDQVVREVLEIEKSDANLAEHVANSMLVILPHRLRPMATPCRNGEPTVAMAGESL